jgi:phosphoribosylaminoimidazole-succinocarboxamide synthase
MARLPQEVPRARVSDPDSLRSLRSLRSVRLLALRRRRSTELDLPEVHPMSRADSSRSSSIITDTALPGLERIYRGKVRDVYAVDQDHLLFVATDRISAFDRILATPIPQKGAVLNQISAFWFRQLAGVLPNHMVTERARDLPAPLAAIVRDLGGRAMLVRKARVVPIECVVRGYLAGSVEKAYQRDGAIQGVKLPAGIPIGGRFPQPIFTPTTKSNEGHDQPLTWDELVAKVGEAQAKELRDTSLALFAAASERCAARGLLLCDTKFELGRTAAGELLLVDEALTPDSSRFFKASEHRPGERPVPWDKQLVRDHLNTLPPGAMEAAEAPGLPPEVVKATVQRYKDVFALITGRSLDDAVAEAVA